jgi:hypothetical protein
MASSPQDSNQKSTCKLNLNLNKAETQALGCGIQRECESTPHADETDETDTGPQ